MMMLWGRSSTDGWWGLGRLGNLTTYQWRASTRVTRTKHLQKGTHVACHGNVNDEESMSFREATHAGEKSDLTKKKNRPPAPSASIVSSTCLHRANSYLGTATTVIPNCSYNDILMLSKLHASLFPSCKKSAVFTVPCVRFWLRIAQYRSIEELR